MDSGGKEGVVVAGSGLEGVGVGETVWGGRAVLACVNVYFHILRHSPPRNFRIKTQSYLSAQVAAPPGTSGFNLKENIDLVISELPVADTLSIGRYT